MTKQEKLKALLESKSIKIQGSIPTVNGFKVGELCYERSKKSDSFAKVYLTVNNQDCCSICGGRHHTNDCKHKLWYYNAHSLFKILSQKRYSWSVDKNQLIIKNGR